MRGEGRRREDEREGDQRRAKETQVERGTQVTAGEAQSVRLWWAEGVRQCAACASHQAPPPGATPASMMAMRSFSSLLSSYAAARPGQTSLDIVGNMGDGR